MYLEKIVFIISIILVNLFYNLLKKYIPKYGVSYILNNFDKGNFKIIDNNKNVILKKINDSTKPIPTIKLINEENFYNKVYKYKEIGLGESYMNGDWESNDLVDFMNSLCMNKNNKLSKFSLGKIYNKNILYDKSNISHHYDVGNDLYMKFLKDDLSAYTCGFWFNEKDTLNDAQYNKVNTIIKKLDTKPNKKILDIGCGWGKIANYISKKTNCSVTGITISDEQVKFANKNYDKNKNKIKIINIDYRNLHDNFDYIYSIEMFEAVRYENYDSFFQMIKRCLNPSGRFVLHTIISLNINNTTASTDNFVTKHIFPGGQIPNNDWITDTAKKNGLNIIHFEGFGGQHYAKTLKSWRENIIAEKDYIIKHYSIELLKKYEYYFAIFEAAFNTGLYCIGHYVIVHDTILSTNNSFNYKK